MTGCSVRTDVWRCGGGSHVECSAVAAFRSVRTTSPERAAATRRCARSGLTLVELLIVIVIMGIMLAASLPRISQIRTGMRIDGAAQQVLGDLRRARSEALKRNQSVLVRKTGSTTYDVQFVGIRALPTGVEFTAGSDSIRFGAFGPPVSGGASFTLGFGGRTRQVTLSASGLMAVR